MKKSTKPATGKPAANETVSPLQQSSTRVNDGITIGNDIWFDNSDLKRRLHVSDRTLLNWRKNGLLPFHNLGGKIYYKESELVAITEKRQFARNKKQYT